MQTKTNTETRSRAAQDREAMEDLARWNAYQNGIADSKTAVLNYRASRAKRLAAQRTGAAIILGLITVISTALVLVLSQW